MDYKKFDNNKIVLRLTNGEEVNESLVKLAAEENIRAAYFSGIGALEEMKVGTLLTGETSYRWDYYEEDLQVTSLNGNIGIVDGKHTVHTHITCSQPDSNIIGGHLDKGITSHTMEIFIDVLDGEVVKRKNPDLGINVIEFE